MKGCYNIRYVILICVCLPIFSQDFREMVHTFPNGQVQEKYTVVQLNSNLKHHGTYTRYSITGQIVEHGEYVFGKRVGTWSRIDSRSRKIESWYANGEKTLETVFFSSGQKAEEHALKNEKRHGQSKQWHSNGQLKSMTHYKDGHKAGLNEWWLPDGSLQGRVSWAFSGKGYVSNKVGIETNWYRNGEKQRITIHCPGVNQDHNSWSKVWREWDEQGRLLGKLPSGEEHLIPCWDKVSDELGIPYKITLSVTSEGCDPVNSSVTCSGRPSNIFISGTVVDQEGHPVSGATVFIKRFSASTQTDRQGQYQLEAKAGGIKPFSEEKHIEMICITRELAFLVTCDKSISVPGTFLVDLSLQDETGRPEKDERIVVEMVNGKEIPFFSIVTPVSARFTDQNGKLSLEFKSVNPVHSSQTAKNSATEAILSFSVVNSQSDGQSVKKIVSIPFDFSSSQLSTTTENSPAAEDDGTLSIGTFELHPLLLIIIGLIALPVGILILALLGYVFWTMKRLFYIVPIAGAVILLIVFQFEYLEISAEPMAELSLLGLAVHPHTSWTVRRSWIPIAAWAVGSFIAGLLIRGGLRGLLTGLALGLSIWVVSALELMTIKFTGIMELYVTIIEFINRNSEDFIVSMIVAVTLSGMGGLVFRVRRETLDSDHHDTLRNDAFNNYDTYHGEDDDDFSNDIYEL